MRHGVKSDNTLENNLATNDSQEYTAKIPGHQLGCYFCNDIVAPGNVSNLRKAFHVKACHVKDKNSIFIFFNNKEHIG